MKINKYEIKQAESIKLLDVLLDEDKIPKSIELLPKGPTFLSKQSLLSLCYSDIHSYINYANVAWGSTYMTNLKKKNLVNKRMQSA